MRVGFRDVVASGNDDELAGGEPVHGVDVAADVQIALVAIEDDLVRTAVGGRGAAHHLERCVG